MNLQELGKILSNPSAIKLISYLIEHENSLISQVQISENSGISTTNISHVLNLIEQWIERKPKRNFRAKQGYIVIPVLNKDFKEFFINLKNTCKDV